MSWQSIRRDGRVWLFTALIFGLLLAVYGVSLANDFVRWDDGLLIYENPAVREISLRSLVTIFTTFDPELYIPLTLLNYQILYQVFGQAAWGYHLWSLLLHTMNVLLVSWLILWLTGKRSIAAVAGVLFALHPIHVEAVAWASALKDQLSTAFYMLTILAYLHSRDRGSRRSYIWSIIFMLLGLLSKVMVVTVPIVLILLDDLSDKKWWSRKALLEKLPYFSLSVIFGLVALLGKQGIIATITPWQTILMAFRSCVFYLEKLFWPSGFSVLYPYAGNVSISNPDIAISVIIVAALVAGALYARRWSKIPAFCILFFLVTLVPTFVNFSKGGNLYVASDRYAYLPSVGLFLLVTVFLYILGDYVARSARGGVLLTKSSKNTIQALGVTVVMFLGFLSFQQSKVWANSELLFRNVLKFYPNSYAAHNNIGNVLRRQGNLDAAITEFQAALASSDQAKIRDNLGAVYVKKGMFTQAAEQFDKAEALEPTNAEPDFGRGILYTAMGDYDRALAAYTRSIGKSATYTNSLVNRGSLLLDLDRKEEAEADFRKAIELEPFLAQAHFNLAVIATRDGKTEEAIARYKDVIDMQPYFMSARLNLGVLYAKIGKLPEATKVFEAVLKIDPGNADAQNALRQIEAAQDQ